MHDTQTKIGIIGGSGLYNIEGIEIKEKKEVQTPFGNPSSLVTIGKLVNKEVVFLPRHGEGHVLLPTDINFRANIYAMKMLGVTHIISISAVGSMKENLKPGNIVVIDQFIDRTKKRADTFFGEGIAAHVSFAHPICENLATILFTACKKAGVTAIKNGTYLCIEGPQFSSKAESLLYRSWGVDVIGMTNATEAKLAKEAEICYATLALVTDYDCWHEGEEDVSVTNVLEIINKNVNNAKQIIKEAVNLISAKRECACEESLKGAIITAKDKIGKDSKKKLEHIIRKYL